MKKVILKASICLAAVIGTGLFLTEEEAFAHGYVESPPSRGYQGVLDISSMGWWNAFVKYGNVITNPQSLEALKGFPEAGPVDGRIASAEGGFGQINDYVLDDQGADRWIKQNISTGPMRVDWHYTAAHRTTKWHYYMTKPGWDQNAPLSRDSLELITTIDHDGSEATNNQDHTINIPENRMGYHIILAVWDVDDTPNAFYNVIDVNVSADTGIPEIPSKPTNIQVNNVTSNSATLSWSGHTSVEKYNIFRDGNLIETTSNLTFTDNSLEAETEYVFQIQAVGFNGLTSAKSDPIIVQTKEESYQELPTAPQNLHSMEITSSSIKLMWDKSTHSQGIKEYQIYRDGVQISVTNDTSYEDVDLIENTSYVYQVRAVSTTNEISEFSNKLNVMTTSDEDDNTESTLRVWSMGSFSSPELYTAGERVLHLGKEYIVLQTHSNHGVSTWSPDQAPTLFRLV
ncbi:carbohydrate-binding protein [Enterococcus casseliflavus]|nr:carbohydrate-binding protein [Enterococcus casseliflavus]MBF0015412.1 carbohydrate-binding protein [Enterococcus casseliflavus]